VEVTANCIIDEADLSRLPVYEHIRRTSRGKLVILLLDDITPLDSDACDLLTEHRRIGILSTPPGNHTTWT
jgi:hypothetical protein